ncbi:MAG: BON domain-containing protein [Planctomyces sp.]|nr:BON domain-containing protein [Planctomyces sp.]
MRLPRRWVLSVGLLATAPGATWAGPVDQRGEAAQSAPANNQNQEMARKIAAALKEAKLKGKGISLEYKSGSCTITGEVADPQQRTLATKVISGVPGVDTVDNRLKVAGGAPRPMPGAVAQAAFEGEAGQPMQRVQRVNHEAPAFDNQEVAQNIADALSATGLSGFDIEVRFSNGTATLGGKVDSPQAAAKAEQACRAVDGVQNVTNRLTVNGRPIARPQAAIQQTGYPQMSQQGYPQMPPQGYPGQGQPPMMAMHPQQAQMAMHPQAAQMAMMQGHGPAPAQGGYPAPGGVNPAGHMVYNQPNVPPYAWPSYAAYDNSAAVTYPSMYDASAWPYIGPYYPYPQVPLGWRKATLEWDDGYWSLKFNSRTDKWWWFMNPENWHE